MCAYTLKHLESTQYKDLDKIVQKTLNPNYQSQNNGGEDQFGLLQTGA